MNPQLWDSHGGLSTPICARTVPKRVLGDKFIVFEVIWGLTPKGQKEPNSYMKALWIAILWFSYHALHEHAAIITYVDLI